MFSPTPSDDTRSRPALADLPRGAFSATVTAGLFARTGCHRFWSVRSLLEALFFEDTVTISENPPVNETVISVKIHH